MDDRAAPWPDDLDGDLPEDLRGRIKDELAPGKRLLWAARALERPAPSDRKSLAIVLSCIGSIVVGAALLALARGAFGRKLLDPRDEGAVVVLGMLGVIPGAVILLIRIENRALRRPVRTREAGALYALTDRRAVFWVPRKDTQAVEVYSLPRGKVYSVHRVEYHDGSGDVCFNNRGEVYWETPSGFVSIPDVRRVEDLVRRTLVTDAGVAEPSDVGGPRDV